MDIWNIARGIWLTLRWTLAIGWVLFIIGAIVFNAIYGVTDASCMPPTAAAC